MQFRRFVFLLLTPILLSCGFYPSVPMEKVNYPANGTQHKRLLVLLRGMGGTINYYEQQGWIEAARNVNADFDMVAPDAHFGYYSSNTILERLTQDVIEPARKQGYQSIWFAGISMGGLGSLLYSTEFPDIVERIYLFAPYLGDTDVLDSIKTNGGLHSWQIPANKMDNYQYRVWNRLKQIVEDPKQKVKIFLGYGDKDRLKGHDLLAEYLPQNQVIKLDGKHDDRTFYTLWKTMLDNGFLKI